MQSHLTFDLVKRRHGGPLCTAVVVAVIVVAIVVSVVIRPPGVAPRRDGVHAAVAPAALAVVASAVPAVAAAGSRLVQLLLML
jgi:uncharacterized PurR-regulated membrane protein YhhQ (DUF165 family)